MHQITVDHIKSMNNHKVACKKLKNTGQADYMFSFYLLDMLKSIFGKNILVPKTNFYFEKVFFLT